MKVVYVANTCEHVVRPLCDGLYDEYGEKFVFIENKCLLFVLFIDDVQTLQQQVLFQNNVMVAQRNNELRHAAGMLGLDPQLEADPAWIEHGYLTIIRNNWHLLPYPQLLELLAWTPERLFRSLMEEDFLWLKLGRRKPDRMLVLRTELSQKEKEETLQISSLLKQHFPTGIPGRKEKAFAFLRVFTYSIAI